MRGRSLASGRAVERIKQVMDHALFPFATTDHGKMMQVGKSDLGGSFDSSCVETVSLVLCTLNLFGAHCL